jgi:superfamily I DNA and RNA helicase
MVEHFTKEQLAILAHVRRNRWSLIPGCTGSGKTTLALEIALQSESKGEKVLVLCYSPFLAKSLRSRSQGSDIRVSDFNTFVHTILKNPDQPEMAAIPTLGRTQGLRPKYDRPWTQFDEPTEYELYLALSRMLNSPKRFDTVIVDEGHEFKKEWWDLVEGCLSDVHAGRLVIFYDDNQAIYRFSLQPSTELGTQRYSELALAPDALARDCRNGGDIFNLVQQLHPKSPIMPDSLAPEGSVKEWVFSSDAEVFK